MGKGRKIMRGQKGQKWPSEAPFRTSATLWLFHIDFGTKNYLHYLQNEEIILRTGRIISFKTKHLRKQGRKFLCGDKKRAKKEAKFSLKQFELSLKQFKFSLREFELSLREFWLSPRASQKGLKKAARAQW